MIRTLPVKTAFVFPSVISKKYWGDFNKKVLKYSMDYGGKV